MCPSSGLVGGAGSPQGHGGLVGSLHASGEPQQPGSVMAAVPPWVLAAATTLCSGGEIMPSGHGLAQRL